MAVSRFSNLEDVESDLKPNERAVVVGLRERKKLKTIAQEADVSHDHIRQIKYRLVKKLGADVFQCLIQSVPEDESQTDIHCKQTYKTKQAHHMPVSKLQDIKILSNILSFEEMRILWCLKAGYHQARYIKTRTGLSIPVIKQYINRMQAKLGSENYQALIAPSLPITGFETFVTKSASDNFEEANPSFSPSSSESESTEEMGGLQVFCFSCAYYEGYYCYDQKVGICCQKITDYTVYATERTSCLQYVAMQEVKGRGG